MRIARTGLCKAALVVLVWALAHHPLAGLRHLLMDIGLDYQQGSARRATAYKTSGRR